MSVAIVGAAESDLKMTALTSMACSAWLRPELLIEIVPTAVFG